MLQRIFLIVAILAGIAVIVVSQTKLKEHIQGIIAERNTNKDNWTKETARANKAETNLKNTSNTRQRSRRLANTSNQLAAANTKLETTTSDLEKTRTDLTKARDEEKAARQTLAAFSVLGVTPGQIKIIQEDLGKAKEANVVLEEEKKIISRKLLETETELAKFLDPTFEVKLPKGLKGKIMVVDPKWEFVVLNIGANQGVLKDGIMLIHRDSKLVGKVKIANVMPDRCIANVISGWKLDEIQEGDQVLF